MKETFEFEKNGEVKKLICLYDKDQVIQDLEGDEELLYLLRNLQKTRVRFGKMEDDVIVEGEKEGYDFMDILEILGARGWELRIKKS